MSGNALDDVVVPDNIVRDIFHTAPAAAGASFDTGNMGFLGLDLFIRNRGAAALTIAINGQAAITVDPGDVYTFNDTKFWLVVIVSAVQYDFQVFGVKTTTLKRRGLF